MEPITEGKSGNYTDHHDGEDKVIRFDTVVSVVVGESHAGPRRIGMRKMSLPMSFSRTPCSQDLDDPSFIPSPTRKLSLRLPTLKVLQPNCSPSSSTPSDTHPRLRSCLVSRTSTSIPPRRRRDSSLNGPPVIHDIPESSSSSPSGHQPPLPSPPPVPLARITSNPFQFRRSTSSSPSVTPSSSVTSTILDEDHGPVETLTDCCPECLSKVALGWTSEWEDAPWSAAARKKRERDEKERDEQDREFGVQTNEDGSGRAVIGVGQKNGCLTPERRCRLEDDMDGKAVEGLIEKAKGIMVDEVSMSRRASRVLAEEEEEEDEATSPGVLSSNKSPFVSRRSSMSPPTSPVIEKTKIDLSPSSRTAASYLSTSSPSQHRPLSPRPTPTLSIPPAPPTPLTPPTLSPSLASSTWILGNSDSTPTLSTPKDTPTSPSSIFPPTPTSLNDSPSPSSTHKTLTPTATTTSPTSTTNTSFFPSNPVIAGAALLPLRTLPPASPPLSASDGPSPSKPTDHLTRAQTHQPTAAGARAPPPRSSSVDVNQTKKEKIKGMWGAIKGLGAVGAGGLGMKVQ